MDTETRRPKAAGSSRPTEAEIAAEVAHEMRTSLIAANSVFETLRDTYGSMIAPEHRRLLEIGIATNAVKIAYAGGLMESLRSGGDSTSVRSPVTLGGFARVVKSAFEVFENRAEKNGIRFLSSVRLDETVEAHFDMSHVYIIIENLFENALKYTDSEKAEISIVVENDA